MTSYTIKIRSEFVLLVANYEYRKVSVEYTSRRFCMNITGKQARQSNIVSMGNEKFYIYLFFI